MTAGTDLLEALPVAVYTTDTEGRITFYNDAAADLWGYRPDIGSQWCGSWRLFWPDGRPMPHEQCPMAVVLKGGQPVSDVEAIAERPDGTRVPFMPYPKLLRDEAGRVKGAINLLVDISERKGADIESERLAAIVSSSDDAIVSKTLEGRITSWNAGATRIFGYQPEEMIGQPITRIIPPELQHEEEEILAKLRRGERIEHFDTVRVTKDGRRVDISLTVSPLRDRSGTIVGASKVARDITERKRSEELQRLLFDELNHRVKNTLAIIQAIASQSLRKAASPGDFVASFNGRVQALARAHDLLVQSKMTGADIDALVREQVTLGILDGTRIACSGPHVMLEPRTAVQLALVLHELGTNARKYGALSVPTGRLSVSWTLRAGSQRELLLVWKESGVPDVSAPTSRGFGTTLIERSLDANGGEATIRYAADGLVCEIRLPIPADEERSQDAQILVGRAERHWMTQTRGSSGLVGTRILLIEDEPLVAMEMEAQLVSLGCEVVGPAPTIEKATRFISEASFDAALLDANLGSHSVDEIAAALAQKGIPFAFATGYGRDALPRAFRNAEILTKPFNPEQLLATVNTLLARNGPVAKFWRLRLVSHASRLCRLRHRRSPMILNALVERLKRRSKDDFRGRHYEASLILQAVSWYLRYPLSYRDIEEMLLERGLEVDHSTLNRWVLAYAPLIERRLRHFRKPHCGSVRIDETYIRIRGQWRYLYRAIDKHGTPVDFLLTARRDLDVAKRFFRKALQEEPLLSPDRIGTDAAGPYRPAIKAARKDGLLARTPVHYVTKHLQQGIESDHFRVKRAMPRIGSFQSFGTARRTIQGFEAMLWLRKGFGFSGAWTVCEQNSLLAVCFGLPQVNKA